MQAVECADDDLVRPELRIEGVATVQLGLRRVLRDLPPDAAFAAHLAAVEAFYRLPIAAARLVASAEQRHRLPAVARGTGRAETYPAQLQCGETEARIGDEAVDRASRRVTEREAVGAQR